MLFRSEDWEVKSVGYNQKDGKVTVNIQATRTFAISSPMNKTAYDKFLAFAKEKGLVGENASLENWDAYAWGVSKEDKTGTQFSVATSPELNASAERLAANPLPRKKLSALF